MLRVAWVEAQHDALDARRHAGHHDRPGSVRADALRASPFGRSAVSHPADGARTPPIAPGPLITISLTMPSPLSLSLLSYRPPDHVRGEPSRDADPGVRGPDHRGVRGADQAARRVPHGRDDLRGDARPATALALLLLDARAAAHADVYPRRVRCVAGHCARDLERVHHGASWASGCVCVFFLLRGGAGAQRALAARRVQQREIHTLRDALPALAVAHRHRARRPPALRLPAAEHAARQVRRDLHVPGAHQARAPRHGDSAREAVGARRA